MQRTDQLYGGSSSSPEKAMTVSSASSRLFSGSNGWHSTPQATDDDDAEMDEVVVVLPLSPKDDKGKKRKRESDERDPFTNHRSMANHSGVRSHDEPSHKKRSFFQSKGVVPLVAKTGKPRVSLP